MKTFLRFNPAICSINIGDQIIVRSILEQMDWLFDKNFVTDVSSHQPVSWVFYDRVFKNIDMSFVLGSNLLRGKLNSVDRQWDINIFNAKKLGPAVLVGVGWRSYNEQCNWYTKKVYEKILSREYIHSVRDNYTKEMLNKIGFDNVVNTSCATMWGFTPEFCKTIPTSKADSVICTVTDYSQDVANDNKMLDILKQNYKKVYVWLQGAGDYRYIQEMGNTKDIEFVGPTLDAFDNFLLSNDVDYVGTRLHGGIRALQKGKRSLIVGIDNRAKEKQKDFALNVIERENIDVLSDKINEKFETKITIPLDDINRWKAQFK